MAIFTQLPMAIFTRYVALLPIAAMSQGTFPSCEWLTWREPLPPDKDKPVILVVSRDPKAAKLRKKVLEEARFKVVAAMSIEAVTDACKKHKISLAVLGYSLPPAEK